MGYISSVKGGINEDAVTILDLHGGDRQCYSSINNRRCREG